MRRIASGESPDGASAGPWCCRGAHRLKESVDVAVLLHRGDRAGGQRTLAKSAANAHCDNGTPGLQFKLRTSAMPVTSSQSSTSTSATDGSTSSAKASADLASLGAGLP